MDEGGEDRVELVVAGEHASVGFEAAKESFHFVAAALKPTVESPRAQPQRVGRHDGHVAKRLCQGAGLVALVGAVHEQGATT